MPAPSKRARRVAELIQSIVADCLIKSVHDPRLKTARITYVKLTPDFSMATVFFSLPEENKKTIHDTEKAFQKAAGFLRYQLSQKIELRHTPKIIFRFDKTKATADRISYLLEGNS